MSALPNPILVPEQVVWELEDQRSRQRENAKMLAKLVALDLIEVTCLGVAGHEIFAEVVSGAAVTTLDDGEAATIAAAIENSGLALIDERKALRVCASRFEELETGSTVDFLRHPRVHQTLSRMELADAVFNAAYRARMRVQDHHAKWVLELIGQERAESCSSLARLLRATNPVRSLPSTELQEATRRHGLQKPATG